MTPRAAPLTVPLAAPLTAPLTVPLTAARAGHGTVRPARPAPPAPGSVFAEVLRATDAGLTADRIAARLGVDDEVVALVLEHAERLGLVVRSAGGSPCRTGCPTGPDKPLGCHGCPFAR